MKLDLHRFLPRVYNGAPVSPGWYIVEDEDHKGTVTIVECTRESLTCWAPGRAIRVSRHAPLELAHGM